MSGMHVNFLEPDKDLENQLDYAEVKLSQKDTNLVHDSGFKKRAREFYYKRYIGQEISGLGADDYVFICRRHINVYKWSRGMRRFGHSTV